MLNQQIENRHHAYKKKNLLSLNYITRGIIITRNKSKIIKKH